MIPTYNVTDVVRKLKGEASRTQLSESLNDYRLERAPSVAYEDSILAYGTADPEHDGSDGLPAALLVHQKRIGGDANTADVYRVYLSDIAIADQQTKDHFSVSYPQGDEAFPSIRWTFRVKASAYAAADNLSACPISGYTALELSSQEAIPQDPVFNQVTRTFEILPGPWLPFTRYDDDLGPVQGRRRAVENTGQTPSLTGTSKTSYETRDGSANVSWEIQENWSDGTGSGGNPAYPVNDTDFYDEFKGPVQRRTQIVVRSAGPGYTEAGSQSELGGVVTETRYEPYNEFLLKRIVDTWAVPGPVVAGVESNSAGQQVAITTQFKASSGYIAPPNTELVKVQTKDNGTWVEERLVTDPSLFTQPSYEKSRPDVTPMEFRSLLQLATTSEIVAGTASTPTLGTGELSRQQQQLDVHTYRLSVSSRPAAAGQTITDTFTNGDGIVVTRQRIYKVEGEPANVPSATQTVRTDKLGDGNMVETVETEASLFTQPSFSVSRSDLTPQWVRALVEDTETSSVVAGTATLPTLGAGELSRSQQQLDAFRYRLTVRARPISGTVSKVDYELSNQYGGGLVAVTSSYGNEGALSIEQGSSILSSETTNLGDGRMTRTTRVIASFVALTEDDFDDRANQFVKTIKRVMPIANHANPSVLNGITTRYQDLDKWRTVQIVAKFLVPPSSVSYPSSASIDLPPVCTNFRLAFVANNNMLEWTDVRLLYDTVYPPQGPYRSTITEYFTLDPASLSVPASTSLSPQGHIVDILVTGGSNVIFRQDEVRRSLHAGQTLNEAFAFEGAGGSYDEFTCTIPATTPVALSGTHYIVHKTQRYRFGYYIVPVESIDLSSLSGSGGGLLLGVVGTGSKGGGISIGSGGFL